MNLNHTSEYTNNIRFENKYHSVSQYNSVDDDMSRDRLEFIDVSYFDCPSTSFVPFC